MKTCSSICNLSLLLLATPILLGAQEPAVRVVDAKTMSGAQTLWLTAPVGRVLVFGTDSTNIRYTVQEIPDGVPVLSKTPNGVPLLSRTPFFGNLFSSQASFFPDTTAPRKWPEYQGGFFQDLAKGTLTLSFPPPSSWSVRPISGADTLTDSKQSSGMINPKAFIVPRDSTGRFRLPFRNSVIYSNSRDPRDSTRKLADFAYQGTHMGGTNILGFAGSGLEIRVYVPRKFPGVTIEIPFSGTVIVQDYDGELVIQSGQGDVRLAHISGSALVEAREGDIVATFASTSIDHPVSLMTAKGNIQAWFSMNSNATVRMDLGRGRLLSDSYMFAKMMSAWGFSTTMEPFTASNLGWTIGKGGTNVSLNALQGDIRVEMAKMLPRWPK